jgi:hypothetical protein
LSRYCTEENRIALQDIAVFEAVRCIVEDLSRCEWPDERTADRHTLSTVACR